MAVAERLLGLGALERLLDIAAHDELPPHDAHRLHHRLADDRLARARDEAAEQRAHVLVLEIGEPHDAARQHERPGRGVDEERAAMAEMLLPIGEAQLVADQPVGGGRIGNAQQRLGEAHQHHALLAREGIFMEEGVEPALADALAPHGEDELARARGDAVEAVGRQAQLGEQPLVDRRLVGAIKRAHLRPARLSRGVWSGRETKRGLDRRLGEDEGSEGAGRFRHVGGKHLRNEKSSHGAVPMADRFTHFGNDIATNPTIDRHARPRAGHPRLSFRVKRQERRGPPGQARW